MSSSAVTIEIVQLRCPGLVCGDKAQQNVNCRAQAPCATPAWFCSASWSFFWSVCVWTVQQALQRKKNALSSVLSKVMYFSYKSLVFRSQKWSSGFLLIYFLLCSPTTSRPLTHAEWKLTWVAVPLHVNMRSAQLQYRLSPCRAVLFFPSCSASDESQRKDCF